MARLAAAGGNEVESGKLNSPNSSAALAVNTFGWFIPRPELLPPLLQGIGSVRRVEVELNARLPWRGGRHPWLDAAVWTDTHFVGIESKRYEPYRDHKAVRLSDAYSRPVWPDDLAPYELLRDRLRSGTVRYTYLDATQLLKHALGIVTEATRHKLLPCLVYIFAEPPGIAKSDLMRHREEIEHFVSLVGDASLVFRAISYREWLAAWPEQGQVANHRRAVLTTFAP